MPQWSWSISACAEVPRFYVGFRLLPRVYLRVCGGTPISRKMRSTRSGLSPRVRRYLGKQPAPNESAGSISACAEVPRSASPPGSVEGVYLRVCGGTCSFQSRFRASRGLSPRVRRYHCDTLSGRAINRQVRGQPVWRNAIATGLVARRMPGPPPHEPTEGRYRGWVSTVRRRSFTCWSTSSTSIGTSSAMGTTSRMRRALRLYVK